MPKNQIKGIVKDIIIVAIGVAVIWIGLQIIFGTQNPFYVVSSGSMVPQLQVFDVLVVQGNEPFEKVEVGDIIVFKRPAGQERVIVHRVVAIIEEEPLTLRTKGDANPASIPGTDFPITEEEYIGKVAYVIPQIGYVTRILTPPINYIIIAIIIGIMIFKQFSKSRNKKELTTSFNFESTSQPSKNNPSSTTDSLKDLPKDNEYLRSNDRYHKLTENEKSDNGSNSKKLNETSDEKSQE